jgi:hypothetical protein
MHSSLSFDGMKSAFVISKNTQQKWCLGSIRVRNNKIFSQPPHTMSPHCLPITYISFILDYLFFALGIIPIYYAWATTVNLPKV